MRKTRITVNCSNCGTEIERKLHLVKSQKDHFCNMKCRGEWCKKNWQGGGSPAYKGGLVQVNCAWCNKDIGLPLSVTKSHKEHFCNAECKGRWQNSDKNPARNRIEVKCAQCGKALSKTPAQLERCPKPFCDRRCFTDWRRENWQDGKAPQWRGQPGLVEVSCEICGKKVRRYPSYTKEYEHIFCGQKCRGVWMSRTKSGENHPMWNGGSIKVNCAECGSELERIRFEVESRSERFFCGTKCRGKWQSKNKAGPNHPGWRGGWIPYYGPNWQKQRRIARKRDGYQCQQCGMANEEHLEVFGYALHVHHKIAFREFRYIVKENDNYKQANSLKNLITLCVICHRKVEAGKIQLV